MPYILQNLPSFFSSRVRQIIATAIVILLALIGLSITDEKKISSPLTTTNTNTSSQADTVIENAQLDAFDENGKKIRTLLGKKISSFDADKRSLIESPHLYFTQRGSDKKPPTPWEVTADNATVYQTSNIIDLYGNATLFSDATPKGPTRITSDYLHINTEAKLAHTDKAVTIQVRNSVTQAVGMWADMGRDQLKLPSRVKEIHEASR